MKKIFFIVTIFLIPVLFFVLLEFSLRLIGAGADEKLILKIKENGSEFYQLNQNVAKRYFVRTKADMIPQLYPQKFPVKKSSETMRIFLLGGSTMAGFPYELNARINSFLKDRLSAYFPNKKVEVINFGLSAVNSFTVLDFAREIVDYQPDLIIIYMGHNEFYGAFGVGSLEQLAKNPKWVRFYLRMRHFRTFQLLRIGLAKFLQKTQTGDNDGNQTLMEKIARKKSIPLSSKDFQLACEYFRDNLNEIISEIQNKKIPVLVSTLTSNLKDQSPFVSLFSDSTTAQDEASWEETFQRAKAQFEARNYRESFTNLQQCKKIDARPAKLHFLLGKYFLAVGDTAKARKEFTLARNLDPLRFRAPSIFNEIIRQISTAHKIPLVPMDSVFNASSLEKIVGYELISEHLHPNIRGYELMAKTFSRAFLKYCATDVAPKNLSLSDDYFHSFSAVTIFDEANGEFSIQKLTSRWPFRKERSLVHYENQEEKNFIQQLVASYKSGLISWNKAHFAMAEYFAKKDKTDEAIREYKAVIKVVPDDYFAYFKLGNLLFSRDKFADAIAWYKKALKRNDKPFIKAKMGMVYLNMSKFAAAGKIFEEAVQQDEALRSLSDNEKSLLYYYFAISRVKLGKLESAKILLQKAIQLNSRNASAKQLFQLLKANKNVQFKF